MSPAVPVPPVKFPLSLFQLCRDWKKPHPASSALNQNNYPEKCSAEPVRGEGNEAQRLLAITSLQSLLVISLLLWEEDPGGLGGGHVQPTGRRTDREKAWCDSSAQKVSAFSEDSGSTTAPLRTGIHPHMSISLMFCLSSFLLSTGFKTLNLSLWRCGSFLKFPKRPTNTFLGSSLLKKNLQRRWSVWGPVRICWIRPAGVLCLTLRGFCLIAKWPCNQKFLKDL